MLAIGQAVTYRKFLAGSPVEDRYMAAERAASEAHSASSQPLTPASRPRQRHIGAGPRWSWTATASCRPALDGAQARR
jgi:hypothetical protein